LVPTERKITNNKIFNDGNILATQYVIEKEVKSNPRQLSCKKKGCGPKKAIVKKDVKPKVAAKKWL